MQPPPPPPPPPPTPPPPPPLSCFFALHTMTSINDLPPPLRLALSSSMKTPTLLQTCVSLRPPSLTSPLLPPLLLSPPPPEPLLLPDVLQFGEGVQSNKGGGGLNDRCIVGSVVQRPASQTQAAYRQIVMGDPTCWNPLGPGARPLPLPLRGVKLPGQAFLPEEEEEEDPLWERLCINLGEASW